jgi:FKBP-type peptidyl-prolyl cis-trans isomerase
VNGSFDDRIVVTVSLVSLPPRCHQTMVKAVSIVQKSLLETRQGAPILQTVIPSAQGFEFIELQRGSGLVPKPGMTVVANYTGTLQNGVVFDSSYSRGTPFEYSFGSGQVLPGWDACIALMRQGSKAKFSIPPDMAYGSQGVGDIIPSNAAVTFEVELLEVR